MLFNSLEFIFLLFFIVILVNLFRSHYLIQKHILFFSSLFFYAYWDWRFLSVLLLSITVNFYFSQLFNLHSKHRKKYFYLGLLLNLALLLFFKYFYFFQDSISQIFDIFNFKFNTLKLNIILPIGISFYTFQAISYLIDVYHQKTEPIKNIVDFGLFLSFFPQIIAGPIERKNDLYPQLQNNFKPTKQQIIEGFYLFSLGLFQKLFIGDACGKIVDAVFYDFTAYHSFEIVSVILLFTFQIYADFAGYSNMARGIGLFFGVELSKNFAQPYFSKNIQEFWKRWHITLSTWFKDYLYIPLGGNKKQKKRMYLNIFIVMIIAGFWHGAGWNFIVWGLYNGILLVLFQLFKSFKINSFFSVVLTFFLVSFGWLFFRIESFSQFEIFIEKMKDFTFGEYYLRYLKMIFSFGLVLFFIDWLQIKFKNDSILIKFKNQSFAFGLAFTVFLICIVYLINNKPNPFIYFQF